MSNRGNFDRSGNSRGGQRGGFERSGNSRGGQAGGSGFNRSGQDFRGRGRGDGNFRGGGRPSMPEKPLMELNTVVAVDKVTRKFAGNLGSSIKLIANYFTMKFKKDQKMFNYHIDVFFVGRNGKNLEVKSRNLLRSFVWKFVESNELFFGAPTNIYYDDKNQMYTLKQLVMDHSPKSFEIDIEVDAGIMKRVLMEVKFTRLMIIDFNFLNLALTQFARCPITDLRHSVYCEKDRLYMVPCEEFRPLDLNFALQLLKGVRATAKKGPGGIALANYDVVHSSFFKCNVTILQFYSFVKMGRLLTNRELSQMRSYAMNENQRREMRSMLSGLRLKTVVGRITNYRFADVSKKTARDAIIDYNTYNAEGEIVSSERMSIEAYYNRRYHVVLEFPNMPLIQCMPREKNTFIPVEALMIHDDWQRLRRILPDELQAMTNNFTTKKPPIRFDEINRMMGKSRVANDPFMRQSNIEIDMRMLQIEGRVLPAPDCDFALPQGRQMNLKVVLAPRTAIVFSVLVIDKCIEFDDAMRNCFNTLVNDCKLRGIQFAQNTPLLARHYGYNRDTLGDELLKINVECKQKMPNAAMMLLIVVKESNDRMYNAIKTECEIKVGMLSQVILRKTFVKLGTKEALQNSVARNIYLKVNGKLGGVNCRIKSNVQSWKKFSNVQEPTLFVGIDVTHQAPGDTEFPSISALVGNIDVEGSKYVASIRAQSVRTEWIEHMREMSKERIMDFKTETGKWPKHIVILRDGVSESQFQMVCDQELKDMQRACADINPSYKPTFTVVIVQKRHSTRFYAPDAQYERDSGNIPPGTVVDKFITCEDVKEFYLCAHKGLMGTSKPGHYYVIYDDWDLSANDIQTCANSLCYLFARASMPVSLPAPVFYAHLCCYRARRYWMDQRDNRDRPTDPKSMVTVTENLRTRMYFL